MVSMYNMLHVMPAVPVVHKEIAYEGQQQQDDRGVQLELLIFVFVGKSDKSVTTSGLNIQYTDKCKVILTKNGNLTG